MSADHASPTTRSESSLDLARTLRPQTFGTAGTSQIANPIVEPLWAGIRVIAAAQGGEAVVLEDGEPLDGHERVVWSLAEALSATTDGAILDGFLTKQVSSDGSGIYTGTDELPSTGKLIAQSLVGTRRNRREELVEELGKERAERTFGPEDIAILVVTDLLWLDGQWLLDIPLLERKRLLESILPGVDLVRPGTYVRPPIDTWVGSWRSQGFSGISFKAANSRYHPGEKAQDWTTAPMPRR